MSTVTPEQQQAAIAKFVSELQSALAPARLDLDGPAGDRNGHFLNGELKKRGWPNTIANVVAVINEVLFLNRLEWQIEPAKLRAVREQQAPIKLKSAQESNNEFSAKVKAGEVADAKAKADAESIKQAKSLIAAYLPTRREAIDYADQTESQEKWTKALDQAIQQKRNLQEWVKALTATIEKRYRDREKSKEHV